MEPETPSTPPAPPPAPEPLSPGPDPAPSPQAAPVSAATLAAENMVPEVNLPPLPPVAPASQNAPVSPAPLDYRGKRNKHGEIFDPDVHRINADGRPYYDERGHFRRKQIGRPPLAEKRSHKAKPKETPAAPPPRVPDTPTGPFHDPGVPSFNDGSPAGTTPGAAALPAPTGPDKFDLAAEGFCKLGDAVMIRFFSEEIANTRDEHAALKTALAPALRESDIGDMPPWVVFGMVTLAIYLPKFEKPTVKQRATVLVVRVRGFFSRLMGRMFDRTGGRPPVAKPPKSEGAAPVAEDERELPDGEEMP